MPFDPSGNFTRARGSNTWKDDRTAGTKIRADLHDDNDNDIANGLSMTILKDGRSQITADIPLNGHKLTGLAPPDVGQDAATKAYVDGIRNFTTAITLTGTSTGVAPNQVSRALVGYAEADMALVGRQSGSPADSLKRIAINNQVDGLGTDVLAFNEDGTITGQITLRTLSTGVAPSQVSKAYVGFTEADMSIVARNTGSPAGSKRRIAINSAVDGTGTDLVTFNDDGTLAGVSQFIDKWYFSTATWTKPTMAAQGRVPKYVEVWVQAGGGGGGGAAASANNVSVGSGGGGGGGTYNLYDASVLGATVAVTVGAQGTSGPGNNDGGTGGGSSFGGLAANGGIGGTGSPNSAAAWASNGGAGGGAAGAGDLALAGSCGQGAIKFPAGPPYVGLPGGGGAGALGGGGGRPSIAAGGAPAAGSLGGGGGGGYASNGSAGSPGAPGSPGFVHVREWY